MPASLSNSLKLTNWSKHLIADLCNRVHLALLNFEGYFDFSFFAAACLEGRGTEKQSTVVLSDCLHLMVYILWYGQSYDETVDNASICGGSRGHWFVCWVWALGELYASFAFTTSPPSSSKHQKRAYLLQDWCSTSAAELKNQYQGLSKLFRWHFKMVQHLDFALYLWNTRNIK